MHLGLLLAGLMGGSVVGLTGMGGGAILTPMLVLVFGVPPLQAVSSDLIVSLCMKPVGGWVHWRRGTVQTDLVRWLCVGSVPTAFVGAALISRVDGDQVGELLKKALGATLLLAATAMVLKARFARRSEAAKAPVVRPLPTVAIGMFGGLLVGLTSVGSGSLMIVLLLMLYPTASAKSLVGTDLVQAIPLVASASLGHLLFGHLALGLTASLLVGALPGVYLGARLSTRASDAFVRPALVTVLFASGLKLAGVV